MKGTNIYIFEQMRGDRHDTGHMMNYTQYVSNITQKIISKEYLEDVRNFMKLEHIRKEFFQKKKEWYLLNI